MDERVVDNTRRFGKLTGDAARSGVIMFIKPLLDILEIIHVPYGKRLYLHSVSELEIRPWMKPLLERLKELSSIEEGWDGFSAEPVRLDILFYSAQLMIEFMERNSRPPNLMPLHSGGIQLEWHLEEVDVEISIEEPYEARLWWRVNSTKKESTCMVKSYLDIAPIVAFIAKFDTKSSD